MKVENGEIRFLDADGDPIVVEISATNGDVLVIELCGLTRNLAAQLGPIITHWARTGKLEQPPEITLDRDYVVAVDPANGKSWTSTAIVMDREELGWVAYRAWHGFFGVTGLTLESFRAKPERDREVNCVAAEAVARHVLAARPAVPGGVVEALRKARTNLVSVGYHDIVAEIDTALAASTADSDPCKLRGQIVTLEAERDALRAQLATSEEKYKALKEAEEVLVKRIDGLRAENAKLREEVERLRAAQAERIGEKLREFAKSEKFRELADAEPCGLVAINPERLTTQPTPADRTVREGMRVVFVKDLPGVNNGPCVECIGWHGVIERVQNSVAWHVGCVPVGIQCYFSGDQLPSYLDPIPEPVAAAEPTPPADRTVREGMRVVFNQSVLSCLGRITVEPGTESMVVKSRTGWYVNVKYKNGDDYKWEFSGPTLPSYLDPIPEPVKAAEYPVADFYKPLTYEEKMHPFEAEPTPPAEPEIVLPEADDEAGYLTHRWPDGSKVWQCANGNWIATRDEGTNLPGANGGSPQFPDAQSAARALYDIGQGPGAVKVEEQPKCCVCHRECCVCHRECKADQLICERCDYNGPTSVGGLAVAVGLPVHPNDTRPCPKCGKPFDSHAPMCDECSMTEMIDQLSPAPAFDLAGAAVAIRESAELLATTVMAGLLKISEPDTDLVAADFAQDACLWIRKIKEQMSNAKARKEVCAEHEVASR